MATSTEEFEECLSSDEFENVSSPAPVVRRTDVADDRDNVGDSPAPTDSCRVIGHPGKSVLWKFLFKNYFQIVTRFWLRK